MASTALPLAPTQPAVPSSWFAAHRAILIAAAAGIVTFLVLFIFVSMSAVPVNAVPAAAGSMLAVIAASAVGIERAIETFWTLVGQLANGWWPFNKMVGEVTDLEQEVKAQLNKAQATIDDALAKAGGVLDDTTTRLAQAKTEMDKLQARLAELEKLPPGNQRVSLIAASINQSMGMVAQYQPAVDFNLRLIDQSIAGLTDFVASFKENPSRRMINIWAGAMLGMIVAYFVRLDVFLAVIGSITRPESWWPNLGVALTGLMIGLGSNPTHDVIAVLQEIKKNRASQNQPGPVAGETASTEGEGLPPGLAFSVPGAPATPPPPPVRRFR